MSGLFGSRQQKKVGRDTARIDALWGDFTKYLVYMFESMEQVSNFQAPSPFEEDSEDVEVARRVIMAQLASIGQGFSANAENSLSELKKVWPEKDKALSVLASALNQYRALLSAFLEVDAAIEARQLHKVAAIAGSFKKHGAAADQLLSDGVKMLGKEIGVELIQLLASIHLRWDTQGRVRHVLTTDLDLDPYARDDGIASSVPMLVAHQLGVLTPGRALWLCGRLLGLVEENKSPINPINPILKGAQINLMKGSRVFISFYPYLPRFTYTLSAESEESLRIEDGICQLLGNYAGYVTQVVSQEFVPRIRAWLLGVISFYVENVITEIQAGRRSSVNPNPNLYTAMLEFSGDLYSSWASTEMPCAVFRERLQETKKTHAQASLNLSY